MKERKYTPEHINHMKPNEVFVFGSNLLGAHSAGAALYAVLKFGAIRGRGEGLQGRSYAIPTKDKSIQTLPLSVIQKYVNEFISFARHNPDLTFYVTKIGTGLAAIPIEDITKLFMKHSIPDNVILPEEFWLDRE